jgi:hypothetical protein
MSDLLNSASLVLIPSGYKEDVVYSAVPTDGSGDLSFTRASNGTRVNSAGLVEVCPWNLLEQSNNFSISASWLNDGTTETGGQAGYDGTNNAWLLIPSTTDTYHTIKNSFSEIGVVTYSVYAKAQTYNGILVFSGQTGNGKFFNLSNGTLGDNFGTGIISSSIESVGNGWYRCSMTVNRTAAGTFEILVSSDGISTYSFAGNGTGGVFIQNAQANISSTAKPYFPTTDRLNVPRLTYQNGGGGCPSLLLEKQSTNTMIYSEQLANCLSANSGVTFSNNSAISPDGTQNADKITFTNASYALQGQSITNGTSYTASIYVKNDDFGASDYFNFNVSDGVIGPMTCRVYPSTKTVSNIVGWVGATAKVIDCGNGWFRVEMSATANRTGGGWYEVSANSKSCYLWGLQLEASSYATSLINTTSASATRVADACQLPMGTLLAQSNWTIFFDHKIVGGEGGSAPLYALYESSADNVFLYVNGNAGLNLYMPLQGGYVFGTGSNDGFVQNQRSKVLLKYNGTTIKYFINGVLYGSASATLTYTQRALHYETNKSYQVNETVFFPTALTDTECIALTTL